MQHSIAILTRHDIRLGQIVHRELRKRFKTMDGIKLELSDARDAREAEARARHFRRKNLEAELAKIDAEYGNRQPFTGAACVWPRPAPGYTRRLSDSETAEVRRWLPC